MRYFHEVEKIEIDEALREFLDKLDISGSSAGIYDLYSVVHGEHDKAMKAEFDASKVEEKLD